MVSTLMSIFSPWKKINNLQASLLANSRAEKRYIFAAMFKKKPKNKKEMYVYEMQ